MTTNVLKPRRPRESEMAYQKRVRQYQEKVTKAEDSLLKVREAIKKLGGNRERSSPGGVVYPSG